MSINTYKEFKNKANKKIISGEWRYPTNVFDRVSAIITSNCALKKTKGYNTLYTSLIELSSKQEADNTWSLRGDCNNEILIANKLLNVLSDNPEDDLSGLIRKGLIING